MQVDIHRVAAERAQEETGGADRQRLAGALQRNPPGQGLRHQHRNIGKDVDRPDRLAELADRRRLILAAALAVDALQQLMLLDQRLEFGRVGSAGRPGSGSQSAPPAASQRQKLLVENAGLEGAPHRAGEHEVMVVVENSSGSPRSSADRRPRSAARDSTATGKSGPPCSTRRGDRHQEGRLAASTPPHSSGANSSSAYGPIAGWLMCLLVSATCCSTGTKRSCSPSSRSTGFEIA